MLARALTLLLGLSLTAWPNIAPAQQSPEMLAFPMAIPCTPPAPEIYDNFERNMGELPMLRGKAVVTSIDGKAFDVTLEMFVNPQTAGFSIVVYFDDDAMACILTVGEDLTPFLQGDPT